MPYRPPHKRNTFTPEQDPAPPPSPKSASFTTTEEEFPSLGGPSISNAATPKLNYASTLSQSQPKKPEKKIIPDGWVVLEKNKTPEFGEPSNEFLEFLDSIDLLNYGKTNRVYAKLQNRIEEYEYKKYLNNGPPYLNSWQINSYIKELKSEHRKDQQTSDTDDSSEEDGGANEFV